MRTPPPSIMRSASKMAAFDGLPKAGTALREAYDFIHKMKGVPFDLKETSFGYTHIRALKDFYGCDVQCRVPGIYVFQGEYVKGEYVAFT